jgi:peptidoglycan/LPS O-acetylase OafA/YrhL
MAQSAATPERIVTGENATEDRVKIRPLTSVRFVAAFMIVLAHSSASGLFGFQFSERMHYVLGAGVSFFFVLSGFIIAHTYGVLENRAEMMRFWSARFSRIWPTHALTFFLCLAVIPSTQWMPGGGSPLWPALSNLTLTQALLPIPQYYFSFNAPSWSISTEAYFYLLYPIAAVALAWRAWAPVALGAAGVGVMIAAAWLFEVPSLGADNLTQATVHGLISTSPVTRFFEFACGMAAASLWPYLKQRPAPDVGAGTSLEIAAVLLAVVSIVVLQDVGVALATYGVPEALTMWIRLGASAIPFAAFILVLALERGAVARLLSVRAMVILGEVSFAMYMLHQLALNALANAGLGAKAMNLPMFAAFCAGIIFLSYLVWVLVERPSRRLLNQAFARLSRA